MNNIEKINEVKELINKTDAIIIGAGAGLSTSAGFEYSGERFKKYFSDFSKKYKFTDMYSGGFYPYSTSEEHWAYWSRYIYINRYMNAPKPVYEELFDIVKDKNYFVITTNVDHCFQKAGFDKKRLFYTQGDFGLFQCSVPCHDKTYDNEEIIKKMLISQGYVIDKNGALSDNSKQIKMYIQSKLIPHCPKCNAPMSMNLRADDTFVQDDIWHIHSKCYLDFLEKSKSKNTVFLELGVGSNTPVIIKIPFIKMTYERENAKYICINYGDAYAPNEIKDKSICINADIGEIIREMR